MAAAQMLVWEIHAVQLRHCRGYGTLITATNRRYWIIGGTALAKRTVKECPFCCRMNARPQVLPLPPLHASRSGIFHQAPLQAFSQVGMDFCGPFFATRGRSQVKLHALVIACCVTRAINVEVCQSMSGKSCMAALERHAARYGWPQYINSDNGSNFLASFRHLEDRVRVHRNRHQGSRFAWVHSPEWYFNPPASPTWTGHVECFVKLVKKAFGALKPRMRVSFDEEEISTLLIQTVGFINMRPIIMGREGKPPLTPAEFLLTGNPRLTGVPAAYPMQLGLETRKELIWSNLFEAWDLFREDYLLTLRRSARVYPPRMVLQEGDGVVLKDRPIDRPGGWECGRIVKVHEGKDQNDRSFDVLVQDKIYKRNYRSLAPLPRAKLVPNATTF